MIDFFTWNEFAYGGGSKPNDMLVRIWDHSRLAFIGEGKTEYPNRNEAPIFTFKKATELLDQLNPDHYSNLLFEEIHTEYGH